jgi:O-antigen ligase
VSLDVKPPAGPGVAAGPDGGSSFPSEWEINRSTTWRDRGARRRHRLPVAGVMLVLTAVAGGLLAGVEPLVGAAVLVVVPLVVVVVRRPDAVTVAVIALVYANAPVILTRGGATPLVGSLVPMALLIPLVHRLILKGEPLSLPRIFPLLLLFGATQLSSALAADDLEASLVDVSGFLFEGLALFVLVTGNITSTLVLRRVMWAVVLSGAFLGLLSLVQQLTGTFSFDYFGFAQVSDSVIETTGSVGVTTNSSGNVGLARLAGPIGEKNRYAQILVVLVPIALGLMPGARRRGKLLLAACIAFQSAGIVLTYSRGAVVGLAVAIAVASALRLLPWKAIVAALVAGSLALAVLPTYRDRVVSLTQVTTGGQAVDGLAADGSIAGRMTENLAALLAFRENPVFGVGPGAYPQKYVYYAQRVGGRPRLEAREAHNLYLGTAAELGLPGLLALLAILAMLLAGLWRTRRIGRAVPESATDDESVDARTRVPLATGLLTALVTYMATGMFLHLSYQRYFWLLVALCAAAAPVGRVLRAVPRWSPPVVGSGGAGIGARSDGGDAAAAAPGPSSVR